MAEICNSKTTLQNLTHYEALSEFDKIRQKQRRLYAELVDVEIELKEFSEVAQILRTCDPKRRCFRLINDLLVESNVETVLPSFYLEKNMVETKQEKLHSEVRRSAENLKVFRNTYNIQMNKGLDDPKVAESLCNAQY